MQKTRNKQLPYIHAPAMIISVRSVQYTQLLGEKDVTFLPSSPCLSSSPSPFATHLDRSHSTGLDLSCTPADFQYHHHPRPKTETVFFSHGRMKPSGTIAVGDRNVEWNTQATRWLGVWLDSQLTVTKLSKKKLEMK
jgi:hypothetical protein